ncbi:MAG: protein kinase [Betaproteobacteria bacterium]|nr:protein kinase [Betaproteobacteria bacterium]
MSSAPPETAELPLPRKLGKFTLTRVLGSGSTSTVYLAEDPFHQREVAIKVIQKKVTDDPESRLADMSLQMEAALLGKIDHPHIVKVYDVVEEGDDEHYVVMEYVGGGTMERHCARGMLLSYEAVVDTIFKCAKALEYMNGVGLIHRDIKPANMLVTPNNDIRLSDLGASLMAARAGQSDAGVGTPFYMSPEQLLSHPLDFRSDMFSLGIVFYELLTGEKPFDGSSMPTLMHQVFAVTPQAPSQIRPSVPRALDEIVARMLGKLPSERFPSWRECLDALLSVSTATADHIQPVNLSSASERFNLLRESAFFKLFSDEDLWHVLEIGTFEPVYQGDVLINEGDNGGFFLVLLTGQARISKHGRLIDLVPAGMSMGEISYVLEGRVTRNTTCVAVTDGIVLRIEDEALREAPEACRSRFEKTFLQTMASWLVDADKRVGAMH